MHLQFAGRNIGIQGDFITGESIELASVRTNRTITIK